MGTVVPIRKPQRCPTCGQRPKRSTEANRRLWALYGALSSRLRPGGQVYSPEHFHLYYKQRFLGATDFALPTGEVLTIPNSSADLDTADFNVFMEQVEADAAERGVYLDE